MGTKTIQKLFLIFILIIAVIIRFTNLMWGEPYFFHPDERNMATAVSQFRLPNGFRDIFFCFASQLSTPQCNLHPHFFAYGQFPLYLAFFSGTTVNNVTSWIASFLKLSTFNFQLSTSNFNLSFSQAVFWLRFWSAVSSTLTILLVYLITKELLGSERIQHKTTPMGTQNNAKTNLNGNQEESQSKRFAEVFALLAALLVAFTPGLIQAAHFGTTESLLAFFFMVIVYLSLKLKVKNQNLSARMATHSAAGKKLTVKNIQVFKYFELKLLTLDFRLLTMFAITMGLALATKLSALPFAAPFIFAFIIKTIKNLKKKRGIRKFIIGLSGSWLTGLLLLTLTAIVFLAASPYNLVAYQDFRGITNYEFGVATGDTRVFYTRQFEKTTPFLFQLGKIFPYALGPGIFVLGTAGFLLATASILLSILIYILSQHSPGRRRQAPPSRWPNALLEGKRQFALCTLHFAFLSYLIPNSIVFAKWTRFMTPLLPLFAVFTGYLLSQITHLSSYSKVSPSRWPNGLLEGVEGVEGGRWKYLNIYQITSSSVVALIFAFCVLSLLAGVAFMAIYTREDVRLTASRWIYQNIPSGSHVLSETANVIDIPVHLQFTTDNSPLTTYNLQLTSFDFYHLDENPEIPPKLIEELVKADYIFVPSRRLYTNILRLREKYPLAARYYQLLFSGKLGFEKLAEFTSFPAIVPVKTPSRWPNGLLEGEFWHHPAMNPWDVVSHNSGIMATIKAHLIFLTRGYLPDEAAEETWTVFDHPVVRVYRRTVQKSAGEYRELLDLPY